MFEDLKSAFGGVADLSADMSKAIASTAANARVAYDAAAGYWKPVGGGVAPGGDPEVSDVEIGTEHTLMDTVRPFILPGLGVLAVILGIWVFMRKMRKPEKK